MGKPGTKLSWAEMEAQFLENLRNISYSDVKEAFNIVADHISQPNIDYSYPEGSEEAVWFLKEGAGMTMGEALEKVLEMAKERAEQYPCKSEEVKEALNMVEDLIVNEYEEGTPDEG